MCKILTFYFLLNSFFFFKSLLYVDFCKHFLKIKLTEKLASIFNKNNERKAEVLRKI